MSQQSVENSNNPLASPCSQEPYPGLRPYEEDEQDQFFGRDADSRILLDKILTQRLTLLFAATGVGKSSLLKANVIPKLKSASGKHLDVVYYNDWVTTPLQGLKAEIARTVRNSANWPQGTQLDENLELADFVQFCTLFIRPPLVIMLDQFEELFRYRSKYHANSFTPFIDQLTGLITATRIPVSVVFSMREDFALELNAFKPKLPTLLFENYYRLERLPAEAAEAAIVEPLKPLNFRYEPTLLEQLLQDLLKHDPDKDFSNLGENEEKEIQTVIPPQLQIVCSQLWQRECDNADRTIHLKAYEKLGRAKGLLKNYVEKSLMSKDFSDNDRRVLSRAFDHLVSIQGTKMPHTVVTLAEKTGDNEKVLTPLLEKLASQEVRILRSQQREKKTWYELYHDMYSDSINAWNRVQKRKMLWRQARIWGTAFIFTGSLIFGSTVYIVHSLSHHLRLVPGEDNRVEVFTGKHGWPDLFNQKQFYAETFLQSREIEPDKRFQEKGLLDYVDINTDLTGHQPLVKRITAYIKSGNYAKAIDLYEKSLKGNTGKQANELIRRVFGMKTQQSYKRIHELAYSEQSFGINDVALTLFDENTTSLPLVNLNGLRIYQENLESGNLYDIQVEYINSSPLLLSKLLTYLDVSEYSYSAAQLLARLGREESLNTLILALNEEALYMDDVISLGLIGDRNAVRPLVNFLKDENKSFYSREYAARALGIIGDNEATIPLIQALGDIYKDVRNGAEQALISIADPFTVEQLVKALQDENEYIRQSAAEILGVIGDETVIAFLIKALEDDSELVRQNVVGALGEIGSQIPVESLIRVLLLDGNESVRINAAIALGNIRDYRAIEPLNQALRDESLYVKTHAAGALGLLGDLNPIVNIFQGNDEEARITTARAIAVDYLGIIGDKNTIHLLIEALKDAPEEDRYSIEIALSRIADQENVDQALVESLVKNLENDSDIVRLVLALVLGKMENPIAVKPLIEALKDENGYIRSEVVDILGKTGDRTSIAPLIKALEDADSYIRRNVVTALEAISTPSVMEHLVKVLMDDHGEVRLAAVEALGNTGYLPSIKFRRLIIDEMPNHSTDTYRWSDFGADHPHFGRLVDVSGSMADRRRLLVTLNLPVSVERDQALLELVEDDELHYSMRKKVIQVLREEGKDKKYILTELQGMESVHKKLKQTIDTAIEQLSKKTIIDNKNKILTDKQVIQLKDQLNSLEKGHANWRIFRDSKKREDFSEEEEYDRFLKQVRQKKDAISSITAFDVAYDLSSYDPEIGVTLLSHPLASVREGAYIAFSMKANIKQLRKLDTLREEYRDDPVFRYAAFRAIDLGLWRLEVLGNKDNDDKEFHELAAWQKELEADQARIKAHLEAGDVYESGELKGKPVDEVLERLQWTTMMMQHTKKMTAKFAKDGWVRDWPENATPVNQPYPEIRE
jgi:HEAT repeat protein